MATYVWLILIGVFIVLELCTFEGVLIWFASGSLVALLLSLLMAPVWIQAFAFFAVGITLMFVLGPKTRKLFSKIRDKYLNKKLLGEVGVIKKILAPSVLFAVKFNKRKAVVVLKTPAPLKIGDSVKVISIVNGIVMGDFVNATAEQKADITANQGPEKTSEQNENKPAKKGVDATNEQSVDVSVKHSEKISAEQNDKTAVKQPKNKNPQKNESIKKKNNYK